MLNKVNDLSVRVKSYLFKQAVILGRVGKGLHVGLLRLLLH